jgi:hypothetical protein
VLGRSAAGADHLEYHEQEGQVSPARHEPGHSCHPVVFRGPLFDICLPEPPLFMPVIDTFNSGRRLLSPDEYPSNSFALRALVRCVFSCTNYIIPALKCSRFSCVGLIRFATGFDLGGGTYRDFATEMIYRVRRLLTLPRKLIGFRVKTKSES